MTLLEKAKEMGLSLSLDGKFAEGCPCDHGFETVEESKAFCMGHSCWDCYAREYKEPEKPDVLDSIDRQLTALPDYWANISAINARQTEKGLGKYGQSLEENTTLSRVQRIEHAQEEAIDLLKYLEHLKLTFTDELSANDYQRAAMRTAGTYENQLAAIRNAAYGLNGEAGEVIDLLKKHEFQGHPLDPDKLLDEVGDVLWYCALAAEAMGVTLQAVMERNIDKLRARYPDGFDKSRSINREK